MTEFKPSDHSVRERIETDLDQTFAVSAGAGTGKTTLLTKRYIALVREKKISPTEIVAITFTIKAAAELRERIAKEMEEKHMREAIQQFESAPIGTIHSFCSTILKRFALEACLDPHFKQMDTIELRDFLRKTFRAWFASIHDISAFQHFKATGFGFSHVQSLAFQLYQYRDLVETIQIEYKPLTQERINTFAEQLKSVHLFAHQHCKDMTDDGYIAFYNLHRDLINIANLPLNQAGNILLRESIHAKKGKQESWNSKELGKQFKTHMAELKETLENLQKDFSLMLFHDLVSWLKGFLQFIESEKRSKSVLDFDDLLLITRNLLRDNKEVRHALQNQFKYFLIDEFQDTDPIQAEIFWTLARNESKFSGQFSYDDDLIAGKIFTVGDASQSIYRFRNASVETYHASTTSLKRRGELVRIVQNFRSNPKILNILNPFFTNLLQEDFKSLSTLPKESWNDRAIHILNPLDGKNLKHQVRGHEAYSIASHINHLVTSKTQIYDRKSRTTRDMTYGDVAILFPASTGIDFYEISLRDMGIPFSLYRSNSFFQTNEIKSVLHVLGAVLYPFDQLKVVEALSSQWMGFSFDDLALVKKIFGTFDYREMDIKKLPLSLSYQIEILQHQHSHFITLTPSTLIQQILDHVHVDQNAQGCFNKDQVLQNLSKLRWLAQDFENHHGFNVLEFEKWIIDLSIHSDEVTEARVPTQPNAVQLMTIHQSKGLEFPVVFIANLASPTNKNKNTWVANRFYRKLEFRLGDKESLIKTQNFNEASEKENETLLQEKKRLMYVALTRAKNILVLPSVSEKDEKTFMEFVAPIFDHCSDYETFSYSTDTKQKKQFPFQPQSPMSKILDTEYLSKIPKGYTRTTATEEKEIRLAGDIAGSLASLKAGEKRRVSPDKYPFLTRPKLGIAFHEYAERSTQSKIQLDLIRQIVVEHEIEVQKSDLEKIVTTYLNSDIYKRIQKSANVMREVPFSYFQDEILYEGYIDLLFEESDGYTIVDLKTDQIQESELASRANLYKEQLNIYTKALEKLNLKVKDKLLYFVRLDKTVG